MHCFIKFVSNDRDGDIHGIMGIMEIDIMENLMEEIIRTGIESDCIIVYNESRLSNFVERSV